jgi:hypothetical protein
LHIDEEILERFVINPAVIDKNLRIGIERHLHACSACRIIHNYFADFYKEYKKTSGVRSPAVDEFVSGLYPVIELSHYTVQSEETPKVYLTVLAAMTAVQESDRFVSVATLASEEQNAVVRILEDKSTSRLKIYVITDDPTRRSHAILSIPELSADFVTDSRGQLEVKFPKSNWQQLKGLLRLAVSHYELSPDDTRRINTDGGISVIGSLHRIILSYRDRMLELYIEEKKSYGPKLNLAVITGDNGVTYFIPLKEGRGTCSIRSLPASITLRLYC